jgi:hypothetical protein
MESADTPAAHIDAAFASMKAKRKQFQGVSTVAKVITSGHNNAG